MKSPPLYPQAAIPEPYQILGLRLRPFCLGHYLLLERFGNAFVSRESRVAEYDDLIMGVLVCSMTYEKFQDFLFTHDFKEQITVWGRKCPAFVFADKVRLFRDYMTAHSHQPVVIYEQQSKPSGAHWVEMVKQVLTGDLGYTAGEAMNLPLSQAFHEFYKSAESKGVVTIATEDIAAALLSEDDEPAEAASE